MRAGVGPPPGRRGRGHVAPCPRLGCSGPCATSIRIRRLRLNRASPSGPTSNAGFLAACTLRGYMSASRATAPAVTLRGEPFAACEDVLLGGQDGPTGAVQIRPRSLFGGGSREVRAADRVRRRRARVRGQLVRQRQAGRALARGRPAAAMRGTWLHKRRQASRRSDANLRRCNGIDGRCRCGVRAVQISQPVDGRRLCSTRPDTSKVEPSRHCIARAVRGKSVHLIDRVAARSTRTLVCSRRVWERADVPSLGGRGRGAAEQ